MSLLALQTRLSDLVIEQSAGSSMSADRPNHPEWLTDAEREWLDQLKTTAGFELTCEIQRWWREARVQTVAPLTISLLGPDRRQAVIDAYISRNPRPSSFYIREALPFLDVVTEMAADIPHLTELAAFERAMLKLGQALASGYQVSTHVSLDVSRKLEPHPLASMVRFHAPVHALITATTRGLALPPVEDRDYWLLVAAGLPNLARECDVREAELFERLRQAPASAEAPGADSGDNAALARLWQAGALRAVD
jgi:hypothetical protein